jgi:hypothetical protein
VQEDAEPRIAVFQCVGVMEFVFLFVIDERGVSYVVGAGAVVGIVGVVVKIINKNPIVSARHVNPSAWILQSGKFGVIDIHLKIHPEVGYRIVFVSARKKIEAY